QRLWSAATAQSIGCAGPVSTQLPALPPCSGHLIMAGGSLLQSIRRLASDGSIVPAPSCSKPNSKLRPAARRLSISCLRRTAPILCGLSSAGRGEWISIPSSWCASTIAWFAESPCPTIILVGEKTLLTPRAMARQLQSALGAALVIVPGTAHILLIIHPHA